MGDDAFNLRPEPLFTLPTTAGPQSCGHCRGCQLMQAGTHPDYYTWLPEKGKNALGIDAVREVTES